MKRLTIYRHADGSARWIVWKNQEEADNDEVDPENAVFITYTRMPNDFCEFVKNATKEKVHELLDKYIMR